MKYVDGTYINYMDGIQAMAVFVYFLFGLLIPAVMCIIVFVDLVVFNKLDPLVHGFLITGASIMACIVGISILIIDKYLSWRYPHQYFRNV